MLANSYLLAVLACSEVTVYTVQISEMELGRERSRKENVELCSDLFDFKVVKVFW